MNVSNGQLMPWQKVQEMNEEQRAGFVEVKRDLTAKEVRDGQVRLYALCGCGSGKKFKFCCHRPVGNGMSKQIGV